MVDYLCEEIVVEILARLPAKSLIRFMAVCRLWKSIITSPQFSLVSIRPHKTLVHTDGECYTFLEDDKNLLLRFETDFPLKNVLYKKDEVTNAHVLGSDNGLLCIGIHKNPNEEDSHRAVIIWNPCIRRHVLVPDRPIDDHDYDHTHGFGGTISGSDYKYVRIVGFRNGVDDYWMVNAVEVYSLKTGTWRPRKYLDFESYRCKGFDSVGVLLKGRLHFILHGRRDGIISNSIASFELDDEVLEEDIMLPKDLYSCRKYALNLTLIKESQLAVVDSDIEYTEMQFVSVWVMQEYGDVNSWVKLFNIDPTVIMGIISQRRPYGMMVHLLKNGEVLLGLWYDGIDNVKLPPKLVTYNQETRKKSHDLFSSSEFCGFTKYYKESLVLLGDHRAVADHRVLSRLISRRPSMIQAGYYPVWTQGFGFQWYQLFQDQCSFYYYVWTGFHWLQIINCNPLLIAR